MVGQSRNSISQTLTPQQVAGRFQVLQVIHLALVSGLVLFGGVVLFVKHGKLAFAPSFHDPLYLVAAVLCAGTLFASSVIRPPRAKGGVPLGVASAIQRYQVYFLLRASIVESGALFSAVVTLVCPNSVPAILFVISAATLAIRRPSRGEFASLFPAREIG